MKFVRRMLALLMALAMLVSAVGFSEEAPAPETAVEAIAEEAPEDEESPEAEEAPEAGETSEAPSEAEAPAEEDFETSAEEESGSEAIEEVVEEPQVEETEEPGAPEVQEPEAEPTEWPVEAIPDMEQFDAEEFDASGDFVIEDGVLTGYTGSGGNITIPSGVTTIGSAVFQNNTDITSVEIPYGVEFIGNGAFMNCTNMKTINIPESVIGISENAFYSSGITSITFPGSIGEVMSGTCAWCEDLVSVTFEEGITKLWGGSDDMALLVNSPFQNCKNLKEVHFPSTMSYIGDYAFVGDTKLTTVDFPECNLEHIGSAAFMSTGITSFDLGNSLTFLGDSAFSYSKLESIVIPGTIEWLTTAFSGCFSLKRAVIEPGVTQIVGSFSQCTSLTDVVLPETITDINNNAFYQCKALETLTLPRSLTDYDYDVRDDETRAFGSCPNLVVRVYSGSYAHNMCMEEEVPFVVIDPDATPAEGVTLSASKITVPRGGKYTLTAKIFPESATCQVARWISLDPSIATVENGVVTGVSNGTTTIHARAADGTGDAASCEVLVGDPVLPTGIALEETAHTMNIGTTWQLRVKSIQPPEAEAGAIITFSSGNTTVAEVDSGSGMITAKQVGTAVITATTQNDKSASCKVTVVDPSIPSSIRIQPCGSITIGVNETKQLSAVLEPSTAESGINWTSSSAGVASVDGGLVRGLTEGQTIITATTVRNGAGGKPLSATITVYVVDPNKPSSLTIEPSGPIALSIDETTTLRAVVEPSTAETGIAWTTSNENIASVSDGLVKGVGEGSATITATTAKNGPSGKPLSASVQVTVTDPNKPTKIKLNKTSASMAAGERFTLIATLEPASSRSEITATSNKPAIVEVKPGENPGEFVVRALKKGSATITAKTASGLSATCKVTVKKAASAVKLDKSSLRMGVGQVEQLKATVSGGAATLIWESADQGVAIVSDGGLVTATGLGATTISVRTPGYDPENPNENLIKSCAVEVLREPEELTLNASALRLGKNEKYQLEASVNEGSYGKFEYESSDATVASVDANGLIHASKKKTGSAVITVRTHNYDPASPNEKLEKRCAVEVVKAPGKVNISQKKATLGVGATLKLTAWTPAGSASQLTAKSGKEKVAKVADGEAPGEFIVTAVGKGSATITIRSFNGKKATCKITVKNSPEKIELTPAEATLSVGQTAQITVKLGKNEGASYSYEVLEGAQNVEVDENGQVTAIAGGEGDEAVIQVKTHNGVTAEYTVHLLPAPEAVLVDEEALTLGAKETYALGEHVKVDQGQTEFKYESDNAKIAKVNAAGKITAVKAGTARITISTHVEGVQKVVRVEVKKAPGKVSLSEKKLTIKAGETRILTATVPEGAASHKLNVSVKNPKGKTVASAAAGAEPGTVEIHAEAPGSATVTVKTYNGKQAKCQLTVEEGSSGPDEPDQPDDPNDPDVLPDPLPWDYLEPYDPARDGEPEDVYAGVEFYITGMGMEREMDEIEFRWTVETEDGSREISRGVSPNSSYVRIEELTPELAVYRDGKIVTQQKTGTAYFAVEAYNYDPDNPDDRLRYVFNFEIVEGPTSFTMAERVETYLHGSIQLDIFSQEMKEETDDGTEVRDLLTLHSSNPSVVSVRKDYYLEAVGAGTATVTASLPNGGMSRSCVVTVKKRPDGYSQELTDELIYEVKNYREEMGFLYADGSLIAEEDAELNAAAKTRAQELSTKYSHKRPNGKDCLTVSGKAKAELVCKDFGEAHKAAGNWEQYERDVLFSEEYSRFGCAAYVKDGTVYWCALLG